MVKKLTHSTQAREPRSWKPGYGTTWRGCQKAPQEELVLVVPGRGPACAASLRRLAWTRPSSRDPLSGSSTSSRHGEAARPKHIVLVSAKNLAHPERITQANSSYAGGWSDANAAEGFLINGLDGSHYRSHHDHMRQSSVSYLKAHLSAELKAVQAGETVVVMDRNHPVARLVPLEDQSGVQVRKPLQAFSFQRLAPIVSGGSLEALFEDRRRR